MNEIYIFWKIQNNKNKKKEIIFVLRSLSLKKKNEVIKDAKSKGFEYKKLMSTNIKDTSIDY